MSWRARIKKDAAIAFGLGFGADLFCQGVYEEKEMHSIDDRRAVAIAVFSGAYLGVACNYIYSLYPPLSRMVLRSDAFRRILPRSIASCETRSQGIISTVTDNMVHVPMLYLPSYFLTVGTMQGMPISASFNTMQECWWSTLSSCWLFWFPFMALNFAAVPPAQRVRAVAGANFFWTVTLDYMTHKK